MAAPVAVVSTHLDLCSARLCQKAVEQFVLFGFEPGDLVGDRRPVLAHGIGMALGRFKEMKALAAQTASLEEQLETRKVVDRAKGILMDKHGMAEGEAFSFIQKRAMGERITMRVVAQRVIEGDIRPGS